MMGFLDKSLLLLTLAFRNVFRNKRRSFLTFMAVAVGVWSSLSMSSFARGVSQQMFDDAIKAMTGHIQIHQVGYLEDPVVDYSFSEDIAPLNTYLQSDKIKSWAPRVRVPAVIMSERESTAVTLVGIDPEREKEVSFLYESMKEGEFFDSTNSKGIILGKAMLETLQTSQGKRVVVMAQDINGKVADLGLRVIGTFDAELESTEKLYALMSIEGLQSLIGLEGQVSEVALIVEDLSNLPQVEAEIKNIVPNLDVQPWTTLEPLILAIRNVQDGFLKLWFVVVIVAVVFGLVNTLFMAIFERSREIGLFRALGMDRGSVLLHVVFESVILLLLGMIVGNVAWLFTVQFFSSGIDLSRFAEGTQRFNVSSIIYPVVYLGDWVLSNILLVIFGIVSSLYPAWKASRSSVLSAMSRI
ncbi:hypothetical protein BVY02_02025 [bacterium J17]|nr:hypothetical protein BVY02_02025 [bacterium J17]